MTRAFAGLFVLVVTACGGAPVDRDEVFAHIQAHEATLARIELARTEAPSDERCEITDACADTAMAICTEAARLPDDPDAAARCTAARGRCSEERCP